MLIYQTEWDPHGVMPPLNDAEWEVAFNKYKAGPEYKKCVLALHSSSTREPKLTHFHPALSQTHRGHVHSGLQGNLLLGVGASHAGSGDRRRVRSAPGLLCGPETAASEAYAPPGRALRSWRHAGKS